MLTMVAEPQDTTMLPLIVRRCQKARGQSWCPGGLDFLYPTGHRDLLEQVASSGTLVTALQLGVEEKTREFTKQAYASDLAAALGQVPRPINWRTLPPSDLERELLELNGLVDWLRHPELLWELSALRQNWLFCLDSKA